MLPLPCSTAAPAGDAAASGSIRGVLEQPAVCLQKRSQTRRNMWCGCNTRGAHNSCLANPTPHANCCQQSVTAQSATYTSTSAQQRSKLGQAEAKHMLASTGTPNAQQAQLGCRGMFLVMEVKQGAVELAHLLARTAMPCCCLGPPPAPAALHLAAAVWPLPRWAWHPGPGHCHWHCP